jgi:hypothetical protein
VDSRNFVKSVRIRVKKTESAALYTKNNQTKGIKLKKSNAAISNTSEKTFVELFGIHCTQGVEKRRANERHNTR